MKKSNRKCVYRINESRIRFTRKRGKLPMFENFIESKYCTDFSLVDNKMYQLTADIVAADGTVLAKAGDYVCYRDGMGTFGNKVEKFVSDCGAFYTKDDQALQPEVLLSNDVVVDPSVELKKDPTAPIVDCITECKKLLLRKSRKVMEELSPEEKQKYKDAQARLTDEQKEKLTKTIDSLEEDAMEAGEKQDWKKMSSIYRRALKAYRTLTGGEDPEWYEGEDPYAQMVKEELSEEKRKKYKEAFAKLSDEDKVKMTKEIDELEEKSQKLMDAGKYDEIDKLTKRALDLYRTVTGGLDPAWYEEYMDDPDFGKGVNESDDFGTEPIDDVSEEEVEQSLDEEIVKTDELKDILTDDAELKEEVVAKIIDELPEDQEEYSMVDVVKAAVSAEVETSDALATIDALADQAIEDADKAINESAKGKIKGKIVEGLKKKYKRSVFESRYMRRKTKRN